MKAIKIIVVFLSVVSAGQAFAHGEDKPGPNNGFIRMPGAFHTELVPESAGTFKVYLLDIQFANPTTKDSKATATLKKGSAVVVPESNCEPSSDHFVCKMPAGTKLENVTLEIKATRMGAQGAPIGYDLPLNRGGH